MISYNQLRDLVYQRQEFSESFKFSDKDPKGDDFEHHYFYNNNPFIKNAKNLGKINNHYTINFFDDLGASRHTTFDELKVNYWENLRKQFNASPADSIVYKNSLIDRLENRTIHQYFLSIRPLIKLFFESQVGRILYEQHQKDIENLFYSVYTGKTDTLKELKKNSTIPKDILKELTGIEPKELFEEYFRKSLKIWDDLLKITHIDEFRAQSTNVDLSVRGLKIQIENIYKTSENDRRGLHKKNEKIIPQDDFWQEAHRLYSEHGDKCLSSEDPKYPSEWMKKKLTGETSETEFFGYENKDKDKENPIKIKKGKVRELLGNNNRKWKLKE